MTPSLALLSARLAALAAPLARSQSIAFSKSPPVSCSAFLHSIIPAPVLSRSSLTSLALIVVVSAIGSLYLLVIKRGGADRKPRAVRRLRLLAASSAFGGFLVAPVLTGVVPLTDVPDVVVALAIAQVLRDDFGLRTASPPRAAPLRLLPLRRLA